MPPAPYEYRQAQYDAANPYHSFHGHGYQVPNITINVQSGNRSSNDYTTSTWDNESAYDYQNTDRILLREGQSVDTTTPRAPGQGPATPTLPVVTGPEATRRLTATLPPQRVPRKYYQEFP